MLRDLSWFLEWSYLQIFWISWSIFQMRFHWLKILFSSVKFFLLLGFTQYWLRGNCCGEIGLNGVLNMAFLLENKIIFASVYRLWFTIASGKCLMSRFEHPIDSIFTTKLKAYYWHSSTETVKLIKPLNLRFSLHLNL